MRRFVVACALVALCLPVGIASAKHKGSGAPSATVKLSGGSVAAGVGLSWGSGTLTYKGQAHEITVSGLDVGSVGVSNVSASGKVYHLTKLEDFNGNYAAVQAGATVGGGGGAVTMKNQNGVVVTLTGTTKGLKFTIGASGVSMALK
ncbi:MAG TPA: hypothetical protein VGK30_17260 [Candidatus Binatia bacterium]|jgi:hypothetical protein